MAFKPYTSYATLELSTDMPKTRPFWRQPHTMDLRTWFRDLTPIFLYLMFITTIGPLLFGYHLAELNTPQDVITCKRKSIFEPDTTTQSKLPQCIPMTPAQIGAVQSVFTLGGLLGALAAGPLSSRYGRLRTMLFSSIFFIIGPVLEALAPDIATLAVGRLISGVGAGSSLVSVPIYVSEISPPEEKGFFGAFTQIMVNVGIFFTQLLGYFLSHGQLWRIVLGVGGAIGLGQVFGLLLGFESPKWLADRGHTREATHVLQKIRGSKFDAAGEVASWGIQVAVGDNGEEETLLQDEDSLLHHSSSNRKEKKQTLGMMAVIIHPHYAKATFAVIMIMIAQQLTGINSIIMYGVNLLADLLASNSAVLNLGVSALNIAVTAGCAPLVDKLGRKTCLMSSCAVMGTSSLLLGIGILNSIPILCGIAALCFVGGFALGLGPIPFILSAELVGPEAVSATQGWALAANWISTFVVAQFFPMVNEALGKGKVYFIFCAIGAFFFVFIGWYVPETKGKKDADEVWGRTAERLD